MSNCPFQSLVGKLWSLGGGAPAPANEAGGGTAPAAGVCPLGFGGGARPTTTTSSSSSSSSSSTGSKCPLGFGSSSSNAAPSSAAAFHNVATLPPLTLAGLQAAGPGDGLVSIKGLVFAVSAARVDDMGPLLGHECGRFLALGGGESSAGSEEAAGGVLDAGLEGLSYDQVVRLERVMEAFAQSFGPPVARLAEADRRALFGDASSMVAPGEGGEMGEQGAALALHALIEQGAGAAAIEELLADCSKGDAAAAAAIIINCPCPRTGLTPLHKAVDASPTALEVVGLLVARGADLNAPAALYDGDTPLALARRLGRGPEVEALLQQT